MDYTYVNENLISPSLICPICLDVLKQPHTHIACDSAFCRSCLLQLNEPVCPICRCIWYDILPIEYNTYLPKSTRLIRNILDELMVECVHCHTVRRRGQFEHECKPIENSLPKETTKTWESFQMILSISIIFLFLLFIYSNQNLVFEKAIDRRNELIHDIAIDIDKYLFDKIYYLIVKIIEYSSVVFLFNLSFWLWIIFYGDRFTSKSTSRILKKFLEISIIINLIAYSMCY